MIAMTVPCLQRSFRSESVDSLCLCLRCLLKVCGLLKGFLRARGVALRDPCIADHAPIQGQQTAVVRGEADGFPGQRNGLGILALDQAQSRQLMLQPRIARFDAQSALQRRAGRFAMSVVGVQLRPIQQRDDGRVARHGGLRYLLNDVSGSRRWCSPRRCRNRRYRTRRNCLLWDRTGRGGDH